MKIICVPDIHQSNHWRKLLKIDLNTIDKIVFLGDYFDNWENEWPYQGENFENIIQFKKDSPDKIDVLFGNHDTSYLLDERCSGYQHYKAKAIKEMIEDSIELMQVISVYDNYIFSHAGVSYKWMRCAGIKDINKINKLFKERPNFFRWVGPDNYGDNANEGPLWIRPESLYQTSVKGYNQIVGHTEAGLLRYNQSPYSGMNILCIDSRTHENIILLDTETGKFEKVNLSKKF
jgi:predicted MPP superfamily phosphohydrolase